MSDPLDTLQNELRALAQEPAPAGLKQRIAAELDSQPQQSAAHSAPARMRQRLPWNLGVLDCAVLALCAGLSIYIGTQVWRAYVRHTVAGDKWETKPSTEAERTRIAQLVKQLESDDFAEREQAQRELEKLDASALEVLESLRKKESNPDFDERLRIIVRHIRANTLLAQVETLSPGTGKVFNIPEARKRHAEVLAWARTVDRIRVAPLLVEFVQWEEPSPRLHAAFSALNFWEHGDLYVSTALGGSWHYSTPPRVPEILYGNYVDFSQAAAKLCANATAPREMAGISYGEKLEAILELSGAAFFITDDTHCHVVSPAEAAQHWNQWWTVAQTRIEWRKNVSDADVLADDLQALRGKDAGAIVRARERLLDRWDRPDVRAAISAAVKEQGQVAVLAAEIQTLATLRDSGKILFTATADACKRAVWVMNPDGSRKHPLFPDDLKKRDWYLRLATDDLLLLGGHGDGLYWWRPGLPAPVEVEHADVTAAFVRAGTTQLVYLGEVHDREHGWAGALKVYDMATQQQLAVPKDLASAVEEISLSPDGKFVAFSRNAPQGGRAVFVYNLENSKVQHCMTYPDSFSLRTDGSYSTWSADGAWLEHFGYEGTIADTEQNTYLQFFSAAGDFAYRLPHHTGVWLPHSPQMLLRANDENRDFKLFTPPATYTPVKIVDLPQIQSLNMKPLTDELVLFCEGYVDQGGIWAVNLTSGAVTRLDKAKPLYTNPESMNTFECDGQRWLIGAIEHLPGTIGEQIGLLSLDGKIALPLTHFPSGAHNPSFVHWKDK